MDGARGEVEEQTGAKAPDDHEPDSPLPAEGEGVRVKVVIKKYQHQHACHNFRGNDQADARSAGRDIPLADDSERDDAEVEHRQDSFSAGADFSGK